MCVKVVWSGRGKVQNRWSRPMSYVFQATLIDTM